MKHLYKKSIAFITVLLLSTAVFSQDFSEGVLILNEGLFGSDTASVSHLNESGMLTNDVYSTQNSSMALGNTAQSMGFNGNFAYIVLNGTNAVRVVNRTTFQVVTTITNQMSNPRNIAFANGNGYVTNWGDGVVTTDDYIAVIDLATNTVTGTIPVVEGPEEIVEKNGNLFIAHQGGFGQGNTISVIDTTDNSIQSITVGDVPSALKVDDNNLYVLCSGNPSFTGNETAGSLFIIDLNNYTNIIEFTFPGLEHPAFLGLDTTDLFYTLNSDIYKMDLTASSLPTVPFIDTAAQSVSTPYSFNKIGNQLYLGDALDFVSNGTVFVYEDNGSFSTQYTVGLLPNAFYDAGENTLGINDVSQNSITLYPNPASNNFKLNTREYVNVSIIDVSGRLVRQTKFVGQNISLEGLNTGMYIVQLEINGKTTTQKLMVK
ncbi:YncE family protein [Winogradskyella sp.]|uniref:YncE family protein n=1 Tax=Winogradskyella sp. TaxID=1883156 RepID=UPI00261F253C|nr:DUF5074 domain-containing protein [Winogradskyella sp.]